MNGSNEDGKVEKQKDRKTRRERRHEERGKKDEVEIKTGWGEEEKGGNEGETGGVRWINKHFLLLY